MTIKLPLSATELVEAARSQHHQESQQVEKEMLDWILPKTIDVVFKYDPACSKVLDGHPAIRDKDFLRELSQNLWSYPGSSGVARIRTALTIKGVDDDDADILAQAILNLTRYPMSIVNYMRHVRSSINSIGNVFLGPKAPDSVLQEMGYSKAKISSWMSSSKSLSNGYIKDGEDFRKWLGDVEEHLRQFMPMQIHINNVLSGRTTAQNPPQTGFGMTAITRAYARRFGNYVSAHAKLNSSENTSRGFGSTMSDEVAKLISFYDRPDNHIYQGLVQDFKRRSNRISATVSAQLARPTKRASAYQKFIEQSLNLNGKKVEIRTSSPKLSQTLIKQFMKSLWLQFELNPEQPVLSSRLNVGNEAIEVEVEKPAKNDLKKVQSFIETMYLD